MGSAAVILILAAGCAIMAILWRDERSKGDKLRAWFDREREKADADWKAKVASLEAEIQRLRKIPLTQPTQRADNSVVQAKSAAQVRQITESAWGKMPEIGEN